MSDLGLKPYKIGQWEGRYLERALILPPELKEQLDQFLKEWAQEEFVIQRSFYPAPPLFRQFATPSCLIRVDFTFWRDKIRVYEVEQAPAGLGIFALTLSLEDRRRVGKRLKNCWGEISDRLGVVFLPSRAERWEETLLGVHLFLPSFRKRSLYFPKPPSNLDLEKVERLGFKLDENVDSPLWVRGSPEDYYPRLEENSIVPVIADGNKEWIIKRGEAKKVSCFEELNLEQAFALKPVQGAGSRGLYLWHPRSKVRKKLSGFSTKTQLSKSFSEDKLIQPYFPPLLILKNRKNVFWEEVELEPQRGFRGIFRIFAVWHTEEKRYYLLGGVMNVRENQVRIHGANDAWWIPVVVE